MAEFLLEKGYEVPEIKRWASLFNTQRIDHTGVQYSMREFITWAAAELGVALEFTGTGVDEIATVVAVTGVKASAVKPCDVLPRIDPRYFRPAEVETLLGDPSKAREKLGWVHEIAAKEMCAEMVSADLRTTQRHALQRAHGHDTPGSLEG